MVRRAREARRRVAAAAVAILVLDAVVAVVTTGQGLVLRPLLWVAVLALIALAGTAGRSTAREVRLEGDDLVVEHADRSVMRFPVAELGGVGYGGKVLWGQLVDGAAYRASRAWTGQLVLVGRDGVERASRRISWVRVDDLRTLAERAGLAWLDVRHPELPTSRLSPAPSSAPAPMGATAADDPVVAGVIARMRRHRRRHLGGLVGLLVAGYLLAWAAVATPDDSRIGPLLGWPGGIAIAVALLGLLLAPVNDERPARYRRPLREGTWHLVEVVVLDGVSSDPGKRAVGLCDPTTGQPIDRDAWWGVAAGGGRGWLQGNRRGWAWIAVSTRGGSAVLADEDRRHLARLVRRGGDAGACKAAWEAYGAACARQAAVQASAAARATAPPPAWPQPPAWPLPPAWAAPPAWATPMAPPAVASPPGRSGPPPGWVPPPPVPDSATVPGAPPARPPGV